MIDLIKLKNMGSNYALSYVDEFGVEKVVPDISSAAFNNVQGLVTYLENLKTEEQRQIEALNATLAEKENIITEKDTVIVEKENEIVQKENIITEKLNIIATILESALTDEQRLALASIHPEWTVGVVYAVGKVVRVGSDLYKVIQAHTSQSDWAPATTPALFVKVVPPTVIPNFVQPTGAQDAYALGAKVLFNGKVYESLIPANTYSPTAYPAGWKLV